MFLLNFQANTIFLFLLVNDRFPSDTAMISHKLRQPFEMENKKKERWEIFPGIHNLHYTFSNAFTLDPNRRENLRDPSSALYGVQMRTNNEKKTQTTQQAAFDHSTIQRWTTAAALAAADPKTDADNDDRRW